MKKVRKVSVFPKGLQVKFEWWIESNFLRYAYAIAASNFR